MGLISLLAKDDRYNKHEDEDMMREAIKVLVPDTEDGSEKLKISVKQVRNGMEYYGERMSKEEVDLILKDCADLIQDEYVLIDDLANYLINR